MSGIKENMAASRKKRNWQRRCRGAKRQPGFTEPTLALSRGQAHAPNHSSRAKLSALFRLRTMTDSPALPTAPFHYTNPLRRLRGAFRCIPTVANYRDSQEQLVRFPTTKTARLAARLRPARISNSPRVSARGQDTGSNTARGSACRRRRAIAVSTGFACSDFTLVPRV